MRHHSAHEISAKLRQAEQMLAHGQSQAQVCKTLGVSVMTFHRWRKLDLGTSDVRHLPEASATTPTDEVDAAGVSEHEKRLVDELKLENDRLRRIVTDLLLEKMKIQEELGVKAASKATQRG